MAQRWIMHVDMDAFFASVEQLDNPELRGRPVMVGGEHRGVVSAASYEARKFGVHSAMPVAQAKRLCPNGVLVRGRMARYKELSSMVMEVIHGFSPVVEQTSVDEAYVDVSGTERLYGSVEEVARALKTGVQEATGLTCSVGVAPVKFLAKIASDQNKPDGITIIRPEEVQGFLETLPVGRIPGVGPKARVTLARWGVTTVGDVLKRSRAFWERRMGERGLVFYDRAQGIDPSGIVAHGAPKSSSAETTLSDDISDKRELSRWLMVQAERVGHDLRRHGLRGRTVTLKLKYSDFKSITRSRTLPTPTDSTDTIYEVGMDLLAAERLERAVRLIGVGISNFGEVASQLSLLGGDTGDDPERRRLDSAIDAIRDKFGGKALSRGKVFGLKDKK
ncbi:DNA polymerase IV [Desulfovibrio ferrophilus]|uniref:DNA polymerase IV n=1 Tax=Desulfovibrio ferrophilus TaxID=241368 RepID=A0A2Z6AUX6_9BACT|nr:DNA polymerase IV [Desulfovibrio ferrophilus]BBD07037.1 DNA-directed DNA polymerase [Desulfovibrio ferrophilus]